MRSLRWKILLMSLLIVFIPVYFLNRYALHFFDRFTRVELEQHLRHYAFIVGEQYKLALSSAAEPPVRPFQQILSRTASEIGSRVQVVSREGTVLYDSGQDSQAGKSLIERPEIAEAVTGAYSARARLTPDRRFMYYYIARPVKDDGGATLAVVYITRHTGPIIAAIQRMIRNQRLATYLALGVAAAAATLLSLTLTRRLRALTRAAKRYAEGRGDLPTRVRGRDEIAELDRALHEMAGEIASRSAYNRDFVSTTLHELRSPLTAIKGAAEVLQSPASQPREVQEKFTRNILRQADRMMRLVGELRELTRLDAESRREDGERLDYVAFVRAALERLGETFPEPHAALVVDLPPAAIPVVAMPQRIEQVLSNLLENAFRYTPPSGTVTVRVLPPANGRVATAVEDTGRGIAPDDLPRVFDRFFTTVKHDEPRDYGSGLGLAIARSIVRNHRGSIRAESEPGRGARFTFELPTA